MTYGHLVISENKMFGYVIILQNAKREFLYYCSVNGTDQVNVRLHQNRVL